MNFSNFINLNWFISTTTALSTSTGLSINNFRTVYVWIVDTGSCSASRRSKNQGGQKILTYNYKFQYMCCY